MPRLDSGLESLTYFGVTGRRGSRSTPVKPGIHQSLFNLLWNTYIYIVFKQPLKFVAIFIIHLCTSSCEFGRRCTSSFCNLSLARATCFLAVDSQHPSASAISPYGSS